MTPSITLILLIWIWHFSPQVCHHKDYHECVKHSLINIWICMWHHLFYHYSSNLSTKLIKLNAITLQGPHAIQMHTFHEVLYIRST